LMGSVAIGMILLLQEWIIYCETTSVNG